MMWNGIDIPHQIASVLDQWGWQGWRPIQKVALPAILSGQQVLLISPTASGKTEAMWIPLIMRGMAKSGQIIGVYPTKALVHDQLSRITAIAESVGLTIGIQPGSRIFLTTPEGLESVLRHKSSLTVPIDAIVADEAHRLTDLSRGSHMRVLIGWMRKEGHQPLIISATATPGNAMMVAKLLDPWMPPRPLDAGLRKPVQVHVHAADKQGVCAYLAQVGHHAPAIIFARSKRTLETLHHDLAQINVESFVHHGDIPLSERNVVEARLRAGVPGLYLATVGLEAGIDLSAAADLIHIGLPTSVTSLTQRVGRGRHHHARICMLIPIDRPGYVSDSQIVGCHAMASLMSMGWSEPPESVADPEILATIAGLSDGKPMEGRWLVNFLVKTGPMSSQQAINWVNAAIAQGVFSTKGHQVFGKIKSPIGIMPSFPDRKLVTNTGRTILASAKIPPLPVHACIAARGRSWGVVSMNASTIVVREGSGKTCWSMESPPPAWHPDVIEMALKSMSGHHHLDMSSSRLKTTTTTDEVEVHARGIRWWIWSGGGTERCLDALFRYNGIKVFQGFGHIDIQNMDVDELRMLAPRMIRSLKSPDAILAHMWTLSGRWMPPDSVRAAAQASLMNIKGARTLLRRLAIHLGVDTTTLGSWS